MEHVARQIAYSRKLVVHDPSIFLRYLLTSIGTDSRGRCSPSDGRAVAALGCLLSGHLLNSSTIRTIHQSSSQASSQQPSPEDEACLALYFSGTPPAADIFGPTAETDIPGRGRGLVSSLPLAVGDLVMAVGPLVVLHGPQDAMPSPDALVEHVRAQWASLRREKRTAIAEMYGARPPPRQVPPKAAAGGGSSSSGDPSGSQHAYADTDIVNVPAVVAYNAYGDEYEDLPAADLRATEAAASTTASSGGHGGLDGTGGGSNVNTGSTGGISGPRSMVGLWPHFNRLNHSCAPNCVHYVVGSTMVVRAVRAIPEGQELHISYLGRDDLAPRQVRQAILHSRYGFRCNCPRCRTEAELPEDLQTLLQQLYDRARHELAPRFERLATAAEATAVAGGAAGVDSGILDDDEDEEPEEEAEGATPEGGAGTVAPSAMTAAEAAKRALRKAGGGSTSPRWPGSQLASLEPRLEECARQLHVAIKELQEDDEELEGNGDPPAPHAGAPASAADPTYTTATATATETASATATASSDPGTQLTRVQAAQAASYQLMELLHLHAELTAAAVAGGGSADSGRAAATAAATLGACWHVLDAISRGSELQVFQACRLLTDALQQSRGYSPAPVRGPSPEGSSPPATQPPPPEPVREAAARLGQSLVARYGRLRGRDLSCMTQAAMRTSRGFF